MEIIKSEQEIVWHFAGLYLLLLNYLPKIMEDKKFRSSYENHVCRKRKIEVAERWGYSARRGCD